MGLMNNEFFFSLLNNWFLLFASKTEAITETNGILI